MAENEIPAAAEAPETEDTLHEPAGTPSPALTANEESEPSVSDQLAEAANEESGSSSQAVQMEMDAADLLGGAEQPATEPDAQAAELKAVLEAVVYVMNEPMPAAQIAEALGRDKKEVEEALKQLVEESAQPGRGLLIREVAGGFQMATKPEHHEAIRSFVKNLKQPLKLSQAALETLAVIAYKQPITLPEILEIRGVQGGGVLKTLIDRKLVTTAGRKQVIGRPMLYKTTKDFLTQFGLKDVNELPSLKEFEEIRRQSMADEEFAAAEPQPNEQQPARLPESVDALLDEAGASEGLEKSRPNELLRAAEGPAEALPNERQEVAEVLQVQENKIVNEDSIAPETGDPGPEEGHNG
ncbi:MAG: SMC-Scp complex subunit ScpB [Bryobacteraceae bacterium]|nr:SMC-Scp complex subunit ScpB [Bryobacteraceae bacterium]